MNWEGKSGKELSYLSGRGCIFPSLVVLVHMYKQTPFCFSISFFSPVDIILM